LKLREGGGGRRRRRRRMKIIERITAIIR